MKDLEESPFFKKEKLQVVGIFHIVICVDEEFVKSMEV